MDKSILEFWGQALLNAARSQKQLEDMNKFFGQNIGDTNPFMNSFFKAFGWQSPEKNSNEDIIELTKKSTDAFKEFFKTYLTMFDVVPKEEYITLAKENDDLKAKIEEQEKIINSYRTISGKDNVMDNLTQIMKNQTQQFQKLMKQVDQQYKKGPTDKKK